MAPTTFAYFVLLYAVLLAHCACKATDADLNNFGTTSVVPNAQQQQEQQAASVAEINARKIVKRAPSGFMGMRGKKLYESEWASDGPNPMAQDYGDGSIVDNLRYKKAPNAFIGMRGKKYTPNDFNRIGQLIQRLEEDELRENLLQDFFDRLAVNNADNNNDFIAKRAPTGFTGMRGKRPADDEETQDFLFDGVNVGHDELAKRAPVNSFLGVRGKKDVSHQHFKRAVPQAFDTRGKKQRFVDFSNKFVAVRGKKNTDINGNMLADSLDDNDVDDDMVTDAAAAQQLADMRYWLRYPNVDDEAAAAATAWHKRAPSGFTGMRGKRSVPNLSLLQ